jgi:hypothetical protein
MAQFEATSGDPEAARDVFNRAYKTLKEAEQREECVMLLEAWEGFEESLATTAPDRNRANRDKIAKLMPKKVRKKRPIVLEDGSEGGWEEYFDYVFPDDAKANTAVAFLERALAWKNKAAAAMAAGGGGGGGAAAADDDDDDDDNDDDGDDSDDGDEGGDNDDGGGDSGERGPSKRKAQGSLDDREEDGEGVERATADNDAGSGEDDDEIDLGDL